MKNKKGFTLIELLVVVAIIGLLTTMVIISIQATKSKARDSRRVSDINSIATALTLYQNTYNVYPTYTGYITGSDLLSTTLKTAGLIAAPPLDPLNRDASGCGSLSGYHYYYRSTSGNDYYLGYCLETNNIKDKLKGENYYIP